MTERDPALVPFDALIGTWDTEAEHRLVDEVVQRSVTFEWLEGGHFLVHWGFRVRLGAGHDGDRVGKQVVVVGLTRRAADLPRLA